MTKEEAQNKLEEYKKEIRKHGYTVIDDKFYLGDYFMGRIDYYQNHYLYNNQDSPNFYVSAWTNTRVIMNDKVSFLKKNVSHNIIIKVNNSKTFSLDVPKEFKKFLEWEDLMVKHIKTALAKKRRFELDQDFE